MEKRRITFLQLSKAEAKMGPFCAWVVQTDWGGGGPLVYACIRGVWTGEGTYVFDAADYVLFVERLDDEVPSVYQKSQPSLSQDLQENVIYMNKRKKALAQEKIIFTRRVHFVFLLHTLMIQ